MSLKHRIFLCVVVLLLLMNLPVLAQNAGEFVGTGDHSLYLAAPEGWVVVEGDNLIILADSQETMGNSSGAATFQPGQRLIGVLASGFMADQLGIAADLDLAAAAQAFAAQSGAMVPVQFPEPSSGTFDDGSQWIGAMATTDQIGSAYSLIEKPDGLRFLLFGVSHIDDFDALAGTMLTVAESVQAGDIPAVEASRLAWVADAGIENPGGAVILNGTLYVGAGSQGIGTYSLDGASLGFVEVTVDGSPISVAQVAPSSDGNLWVVKSFGLIYKVSPSGEVLMSIGDSTSFPGLGPLDLTTDAAGNLYVRVSRDEGSFVEVWTPEGEMSTAFQVSTPEQVVFDMSASPDGQLYVAVAGETVKITVYDASGTQLREVDDSQFGLSLISGLNVLPDSTLIMGVMSLESMDTTNRGVPLLHLTADGALLEQIRADDLGLEQIYDPDSFVLTPDGGLIVVGANFDGSQVFRITLE